MSTPRLEIDLEKITHNARKLKDLYAQSGIDLMAVTKTVCGDPNVVDALLKSGISMLADSRILNIKKIYHSGIKSQLVLLRSPMVSEAHEVVRYADISFNSEISVIEYLSTIAVSLNKVHRIILMVELGDLREGVLPEDVENTVEKIIQLNGIELIGLGTNLACQAGIAPDDQNMMYLSAISMNIEAKFGIHLKMISGGNSANYRWFKKTKLIGKINNLRLGESIYLGREPLHREAIPGLFTNAFRLVAEVIESKKKPSVPTGTQIQNAQGDCHRYQNSGLMNRALLGIGIQDVLTSGLMPESDFEIVGASSDHMILNTKSRILKIGEEVTFSLNYTALVSAMTSPYVTKIYGRTIELSGVLQNSGSKSSTHTAA